MTTPYPALPFASRSTGLAGWCTDRLYETGFDAELAAAGGFSSTEAAGGAAAVAICVGYVCGSAAATVLRAKRRMKVRWFPGGRTPNGLLHAVLVTRGGQTICEESQLIAARWSAAIPAVAGVSVSDRSLWATGKRCSCPRAEPYEVNGVSFFGGGDTWDLKRCRSIATE